MNDIVIDESARAGMHPRLAFAAMMLGNLSQGIAFTAFVAALPQMAQDYGARGEFIAQMSLALVSLGLMIGALGSGWILDRLGTRWTMLLSLMLFGVLGAAGMVVHAPLLLLGSRLIAGMACACLVTACVAHIAATYEGHARARALGTAAALGSFSALAATLIGGQLAQWAGWRVAFVQYPIFAALGLLIVAVAIRPVAIDRTENRTVAQPYFLALLPWYLLICLLSAVMFMGSTQFAFFLQADGIGSAATRSYVMSGMTVISTLTSFTYGSVQRRLGTAGAFTLAVSAVCIALGIAGSSTRVEMAVISALLIGVFVGIFIPFSLHLVTAKTHPSARGHAIGMYTAFSFLGGFLNPIIMAPLNALLGLRGAFMSVAVVMGAMALVAAIVTLRGRFVPRPA